MADIVHNTNVAAIVDRLTGDNQQANIQAYVTAHAAMAQELEDQVWSVWESRLIDLAVGNQLDLLGAVVGALRGNLSDDDYRVAIKIQIAANNSNGLAVDLIHICVLAGVSPVYIQTTPTNFQITINETLIALAPALIQAKALGTTGDLIVTYSGTNSLIWDTVAGSGVAGWSTEAGSGGAWCTETSIT